MEKKKKTGRVAIVAQEMKKSTIFFRENIKIAVYDVREWAFLQLPNDIFERIFSFENCIVCLLHAKQISTIVSDIKVYVWPRNRTSTTKLTMKEKWRRVRKIDQLGVASSKCQLLFIMCAARWPINQKTSTHKNARAFKILLICNFYVIPQALSMRGSLIHKVEWEEGFF